MQKGGAHKVLEKEFWEIAKSSKLMWSKILWLTSLINKTLI
jgi:hypothetical protein